MPSRIPSLGRGQLAQVLKRPVRRVMDGISWRVTSRIDPRLDEIAGRLAALQTGLQGGTTADAQQPAFVTTLHDLLHAQRSAELSRMPKGAGVLLSAGCSGSWYFDWMEQEYGPVQRHIGVECYLPRPEVLPPEVEWVETSVADLSPIPAGSVDLVFSGQNVEHLFGDDCPGFLLEAARVLRSGGHLVMDSPNREMARLHTWSMNEHTVEFTPDEAAELATLAGFDVTGLRGVWLVRDPDMGTPLPLDPFAAGVSPTEIVRRIQLAPRFPEHSFIWWLEAERSERPPDASGLRRRHAAIFTAAWRERTNRFLHAVGTVVEDRGGALVSAPAGAEGYLMYGPYMPLAAADYRVTFSLRRQPGVVDGDAVVARLDVIADGGTDPVITQRAVRAAELPAGEWTSLSLPFHLDELRWTGQFRVWSPGLAHIDVRMAVTLDDPGSPVWPTLLREEEISPARS